MTATTTTNGKPANGTLSPGWRVIRFGEMADSIGDRVDHPAEAGVEYYVGLEHLDPESLKIRRWGQPTDVEATKLRFKPGDIIFGRRRAYQRKLAVAEFEGICSAHALVLRAREEVVLPEFLPFFMQSDIFFERAISISVGSLSPTINWKTLAQQEFALPPRDEQRRIAEILWAADEVCENWEQTRREAKQLRSIFLNEMIFENTNQYSCMKFREICWKITDGTHQPPEFTSHGIPFLLVSNLASGHIDWNISKWISEKTYLDLTKRVRPEVGDVLYTAVGSFGVPVLVTWPEQFSFQRHIAILKPRKDILRGAYLAYFLESKPGKAQANLAAIGLAQKTITLTSLNEFVIPLPPLEVQDYLVQQVEKASLSLQYVTKHIEELRRLKVGLLSNLLSGESYDVQRS